MPSKAKATNLDTPTTEESPVEIDRLSRLIADGVIPLRQDLPPETLKEVVRLVVRRRKMRLRSVLAGVIARDILKEYSQRILQ
jgi:hypothetical protein